MSEERTPNVARAGGIMMLSLLLSRVLGIVRESVMAAKFGVGPETDAYVLAFQIPDLLFFLIAGGALSSAFIPVFSEYLHTGREKEAWKLFSVVVTVMSLAVGAFIVLASAFAEPLARLIAPGKSVELLPLIATMSKILLPAQFAFFIGGLMFGTLYARQRFAVPGLGPNVYNLGIIFGAVVLSSFVVPGVVGMAWGALIGAVVGNLVIPLVAMAGLGAQFRPSLDLKAPGVGKVFRLMLPVVLGLSLPGVYAMIMRGFGSYYPDGVNTALDWSNKLMQTPLGVFGQSLAIAAFPALSQFFAQGRMDMLRAQLEKTVRTVLFIALPASALMMALAPDIAAALFRYGKTDASEIPAIASSLQMFCIGIAAWCVHPVLMRAFFSIQKSVTPVVLGTATTAVFVALCFGLRATPLGFLALPLASSLAAILLAAAMLLAIRGEVGGLPLRGIASTALKATVASAAAGGLAWLASLWLPGSGEAGWAIARTVGIGLVAAWAYVFAARAMKMPETEYFDRAMARVARRRA